MIHKIKALYDNGNGSSIRAISEELGISRNVVRKYLRMDEQTINQLQNERSRTKRLDEHRDYIKQLLRQFPRLSAVKIARKLQEKVGPLPVSDRSIRRYVEQLKRQATSAQPRYYEPVLDHVPGVQCQIDPGELRGLSVAGEERTLYFVVFVLSFSRLSYVGLSWTPLDTEQFIRLNDEAFRYFGGVPEECVYDQTKLVVIAETFRELSLNERFHQYATAAGFRVRACEGYDPESKGKVEAGVKYVKQDCLYGERFANRQAVAGHVQQWLDEVANERQHGSTGRCPRAHFEAEERHHLRPYLCPDWLWAPETHATRRKVDKTGLISWHANKYSVPMAYQGAQVGVREQDGELVLSDLETGEWLATHRVSAGKGVVVKNASHYRDPSERIEALEQALTERLGEAVGPRLCRVLRHSEPRYYKDQLSAVKRLLEQYSAVDAELMAQLSHRETLTATTVKAYLEAWEKAQARGRDDGGPAAAPEEVPLEAVHLAQYARLGHSTGQQEVGP